jgi:hypothetical protein
VYMQQCASALLYLQGREEHRHCYWCQWVKMHTLRSRTERAYGAGSMELGYWQ